MKRPDPRIYLTHILESIELIESYVAGIEVSAFVRDQEKQDAVVRRIEIMGEAVKNLPGDPGSQSSSAVARIAGMRDKVVHDYMGVDSELVWTVATTQLQELRNDVQAILNGLQDQSGGTV